MALQFTAEMKEETEQEIRFRTYLRYVQATADIISSSHGTDRLATNLADSPSFRSLNGGRCSDLKRLGELLRNAWFTELQLNFPARFPDFIPYAIHWAAVQAYYAMYLQVRGYFLATGQSISHEHAITLKSMANEIRAKQGLFPPPWNVLCEGSPDVDPLLLVGLPKNIKITLPSVLQDYHRVPLWDWYALFLKTTRQRHLKKLCTDWKEQNKRKRMDSRRKTAILANLAPTSIFQALYRLRLRSNYEDADSFLLGALHTSPTEAADFHASLCKIVWGTSMVLEMLIARSISKKSFKEILAGFVQHDRMTFPQSLVQLEC